MVYQLGNNPHHEFAYETAMEHPGVVVLHEANLHHLIADLTILRGDWDAYLREVEFDAGAEAHKYAADFVRTIKRRPDYDIPMLKRVLENSRAAIVHSRLLETNCARMDLRAGRKNSARRLAARWRSHGVPRRGWA